MKKSKSKIELNPCPECGAFGPELFFKWNDDKSMCVVKCGNGHGFGPAFENEVLAAEYWNSLERVETNPLSALEEVDPDFAEVKPSSPHEETGYVADITRAGDVAEAALEKLCDTPLPKASETSGEYTRWLPCNLSDAESLDRSKTMTERMNELEKAKAEKAKIVREYGETIKKLEGEISRLSESVRSGKEWRTVKCVTKKDFCKLVAHVFRLDTDEVIETRKLDKSEAQEQLF